jgi:hypothetical protein
MITNESSMREKIDAVSERMIEADGPDSGLVVMDGFDDCIVGVASRFHDTFVVYDIEKVLNKLEADGMTREEAVEFHEFNQAGAWVGPRTPAFIDTRCSWWMAE